MKHHLVAMKSLLPELHSVTHWTKPSMVVLFTECIYVIYVLLLTFFSKFSPSKSTKYNDYVPLSTDIQTKHPKISLPTRISFITLMIQSSPERQSPQTSVVTSKSKISDSSFSKTNITVPTIKPSNPADATTKEAKMDSSGNCFYIVQMSKILAK